MSKSSVSATYHGDNHEFIYENKYPIIQWLGDTDENLFVTLEDGKRKKMFIDPYVKELKKGTLFQIIRNAFYAVDSENPTTLIFAHK